jgi:hypothetical protein
MSGASLRIWWQWSSQANDSGKRFNGMFKTCLGPFSTPNITKASLLRWPIVPFRGSQNQFWPMNQNNAQAMSFVPC